MTRTDNLELLLSEVDLSKTELQLQNRQDTEWLKTLAIENTYHSNRLEGSSLNLRDTEMVISTGLMLPGKPIAENLAALNHYQAIQFLREQADEQALLSNELLQQLHVLLSKAINREQAGVYRSQAATLANGQPAISPDQISDSLAETIHWAHLEGPFLHPLVFAAQIDLRLQTIKPFQTANGLCARLAMNLILLQEGYPLLNITSDESGRAAYYTALAKAQSGQDPYLWHCFIAKQAIQTEQHILDRIHKQEEMFD